MVEIGKELSKGRAIHTHTSARTSVHTGSRGVGKFDRARIVTIATTDAQ